MRRVQQRRGRRGSGVGARGSLPQPGPGPGHGGELRNNTGRADQPVVAAAAPEAPELAGLEAAVPQMLGQQQHVGGGGLFEYEAAGASVVAGPDAPAGPSAPPVGLPPAPAMGWAVVHPAMQVSRALRPAPMPVVQQSGAVAEPAWLQRSHAVTAQQQQEQQAAVQVSARPGQQMHERLPVLPRHALARSCS